MIRITRFVLLFAMGALSLALLAACSSDSEDATSETTATATEAISDGAETTVTATLSEFVIELGTSSAPAGEITFDAENTGTLAHELVIVRSDLASDALPLDGAVVDESAIDVIGEIPEFAAGAKDSGTFKLEAGTYIVFCNVAGHYQGGMHAAFTVE
ncbi:MAG: hypothetical protein DWG80_01780 [Chloroflexi bacterium]|nr:hypothetical protein [Chloroflexota bacterium]